MPTILMIFFWILTWSNRPVSTLSAAWILTGVWEARSPSSAQNRAERAWNILENTSRTAASTVTTVSQSGMTTSITILNMVDVRESPFIIPLITTKGLMQYIPDWDTIVSLSHYVRRRILIRGLTPYTTSISKQH